MLRVVSLSLLAAAAVAAVAAPASAEHRWRHRHIFFPLVEIFPGTWDDEDENVRQQEEVDNENYVPRKLKRSFFAKDQWWFNDEDDELEPVVKEPAKKKPAVKKASAVKKPPKPILKPEPRTIAATAPVAAEPVLKPEPQTIAATAPVAAEPVLKPEPRTIAATAPVAAEPVVPVSGLATASTANVGTAPVVSASAMVAKPAPVSKGIGCTAGAAIVTNYGFADVKPRTCTGDTFAYTASRGGKSFVIKLTAASGEVVDVKKM